MSDRDNELRALFLVLVLLAFFAPCVLLSSGCAALDAAARPFASVSGLFYVIGYLLLGIAAGALAFLLMHLLLLLSERR